MVNNEMYNGQKAQFGQHNFSAADIMLSGPDYILPIAGAYKQHDFALISSLFRCISDDIEYLVLQ